MVTSTVDPRHQRRIELMELLFSYSFYQPDGFPEQFLGSKDEIAEIIAVLPDLDRQIKEHAPERPLSDINQVDLAILRLAAYEATSTKTPKKVIINESVELAKEFGTESSPKFVNGVLGKLLMSEPETV